MVNTLNMVGNDLTLTTVTVGTDAIPCTISSGAGVPTFSSTKGSVYLNTTGSSVSTRLYINNGTTNWVAVTTAS